MEVYAHKELVSCTNMSLNTTSSLALLAGRRCYAIVDLSNPSQPAIREGRQSKWEVVCSQWSAQDERNLAVASNNKVELVRVGEGELSAATTLSAHTRIITDLSWHTLDANLMASSSADNFIYLWDTRDLRRPKSSLQALQGASKIEWNKVSGKLLASTHNGEVKLWDIRKSNSPVQCIAAHLSRIYSLDWSWDHEDSLATSSQDSTVMFWNLANPSKAEATIKTSGAPVWQLQHTPFGTGLLTLVMHTVLRGENNLMVWSRTDLRAPVHTFYGHTDMVLNFGWRCPRPEDSRTRLVTWSKDGTLRLWDIDSDLQRRCGQEIEECEDQKHDDGILRETFFEVEEMVEEGLHRLEEEEGAVIVSSPVTKNFPISRNRSQDSESEHSEKGKSMNLKYEFKLLNVSDRLQVVAQDARERLFTVSAETSNHVLILHVKFPPNYPNQKAPIFSFLGGTTINTVAKSTILNKVRTVAKKEIMRNRRCLEPCLRQFEASVAVLEAEEQLQLQLNNPGLSSSLQETHDHNIPFPRSSGARFCGDGHLVTFGWTRQYSVPVARDETDGPMEDVARTPRALTAMLGVPSGAASPKYSVSGICHGQSPSQEQPPYFPFKARVPRVRFTNSKSRMSNVSVNSGDDLNMDRKNSVGRAIGWGRANTPTVTIYSCLGLQPPGWKQLAANYLVPGSGLGAFLSRQDICERNAATANLVERADLVHLWTLAGLSAGGLEEGGLPWAQHPMGRRLVQDLLSHYVKLRDVQTVAMISAVFSPLRRKPLYVGNEGEERAQRKLSLTKQEEAERQRREEADASMLDPSLTSTYDCYMKVYSDLLYTWRMLMPRAELTKCLNSSQEESQRLGLAITCAQCGAASSGPSCSSCRALTLTCALCRLSCRGLASLCPACGHGGHPDHLRQWYRDHDVCPIGCGCPCPSIMT